MKSKIITAVVALALAAPVAAERLYVLPVPSTDGDRYALDVETVDFGTTKDGSAYVYAQFSKAGADGSTSKFHLSTTAASCNDKQGRVMVRASDGGKTYMLWSADGETMLDSAVAALCSAALAAAENSGMKPTKSKRVI
jgi:hypothetical protein